MTFSIFVVKKLLSGHYLMPFIIFLNGCVWILFLTLALFIGIMYWEGLRWFLEGVK